MLRYSTRRIEGVIRLAFSRDQAGDFSLRWCGRPPAWRSSFLRRQYTPCLNECTGTPRILALSARSINHAEDIYALVVRHLHSVEKNRWPHSKRCWYRKLEISCENRDLSARTALVSRLSLNKKVLVRWSEGMSYYPPWYVGIRMRGSMIDIQLHSLEARKRYACQIDPR